MSKSGTQAQAYVVKVTMDVVVWPRIFGHAENAEQARRVATAAVESGLRANSDLRVRNLVAQKWVRRDFDFDMDLV